MTTGSGQSPHVNLSLSLQGVVLQAETIVLITEESVIDFSATKEWSYHSITDIGKPSKYCRAQGNPIRRPVLVQRCHVIMCHGCIRSHSVASVSGLTLVTTLTQPQIKSRDTPAPSSPEPEPLYGLKTTRHRPFSHNLTSRTYFSFAQFL